MEILNVEVYSIIILVVLIWDYIVKFKGKYNVASFLWLSLTISTICISLSNILFVYFDHGLCKKIMIISYFIFTLISSLFIYIYIKNAYTSTKIILKKELLYIILSIISCVIVASLFLSINNTNSNIYTFNRGVLNQLLILAIIPNVVILFNYLIYSIKNKITINMKIILTLIITIIGLIVDLKNETLYFISSTFTITALILYINKHDKLINTDPLTGLTNKRGLEAFLVNLKKDTTIAVFNIDVDDFKQINDKYGHLKGDIVLKELAQILRSSSRNSDLIIRNGGDEFLIVAKIKKEVDGQKIYERLQNNLNYYNKNHKIKIYLSIGWKAKKISEKNSEEEFSQLLKILDKEMYIEKEIHHKKI